MYTVKIQQWSGVLDVRKGTILEAALAQGVPYPHSCRSGECGHCKTRLLVGEVSEDPYLKQALSDEEREQGYILACRAHPKSHLDIAWASEIDISESHPVRHVRARVVELKQVAADVTRLRLEVQGEPLAFNAGQYVRLSVGGLPPRS
jgi:CDP-4-dehydro-6-deoxyglucose reductase/ferredoxin-NAD(P)+ reductase (naphthalene dioxygenase ferredoxin-specific)